MPIRTLQDHLLGIPDRWIDRTAFASAAGNLTFGRLRDATLRFVTWLTKEAGLRPENRVALCVPKSLEAVITIHGILVSGATYVPLEFQAPAEKLAAILASVQPHLLITTSGMERKLRAAAGPALPAVATYEPAGDGSGLDALTGAAKPAEHLPALQDEALAAIVFTSGSTGEPKGVMLSQRNCLETWDWVMSRCAVSENDRRVSHAQLRFLPTDLLFCLLRGCRTYLLTEREALFAEFVVTTCEREQITLWNSTPTALRLLIEAIGTRQADFRRLRHASFYGEPLSVPVIRNAMAVMPETEFANSYGATEASSMTFYRAPRPLPENLATFPVGWPSPGFTVSIHNEEGETLPVGEVGEIMAIGPTVMMGYWNDPGLTASKRRHGLANSYRTGDLGYLDGDGMLHLVGRRDQMVKLRGHRLDLGEVEAVLKTHPAVREAVAFAVDVGAEREVRAAVLTDAGSALIDELRAACQRRLPGYGRPAQIRCLADFPLLATGKIDRKRIQALAFAPDDAAD